MCQVFLSLYRRAVTSSVCVVHLFVVTDLFAQSPTKPTQKSSTSGAKPVTSNERPVSLPGFVNSNEKTRDAAHAMYRQKIDERKALAVDAQRDATSWRRTLATVQDDSSKRRISLQLGAALVVSEQWPDALETLTEITGQESYSQTEIEARLFLFDVALERKQNLAEAELHLKPAKDWYRSQTLETKKIEASMVVQLGGNPSPHSEFAVLGPDVRLAFTARAATELKDRDLKQTAIDVVLRMGIMASIRGDAPEAKARFFRLLELEIPNQHPWSTVAGAMAQVVIFGDLPDPAKNGDATVARLIRYGCLLQEAQLRVRAIGVWDRVLDQLGDSATIPQQSFVLMRRAQTRFQFMNPLDRETGKITADYVESARLYPQGEWADDALFLAGNVEWNLNQNGDRAISLWSRVVDEHPKGELAEQSAFQIGVAFVRARKWNDAKQSFETFQRKYPKSSSKSLVEKHLKQINSELARPK